jgi:fructose-1-phosphate kinase PfkB-like protein
MKKIVVMGANAARQKTLHFEKLRPGEVNRACKMSEIASGKGINFCRAASNWGKARGIVIQFAGGENGKFLVDSLKNEKLENRTVNCAAPLRCCITCIDQNSNMTTELIEPSGAATAAECDEFVRLFNGELPSASGVAICGSLPDGTSPELYNRIATAASAKNLPLLLDLYKNVEPLLDLPDVTLKINREELGKLTSCGEISAGLKKLFAQTGIKIAAITDGAGKAFASDGKILAVYSIPALDKIANPIGCGDTASAVFFSELLNGGDFVESFRVALGCASANAESWIPAQFDPARGGKLAAKINIEIHHL